MSQYSFSVGSSKETVQRITLKKDNHSTAAMDTIEERQLEFLALTNNYQLYLLPLKK